jgi:hypothetical protein
MTWKNRPRNTNFLRNLQEKREAERSKEGQQERAEEQPQVGINPYILGTRRKRRRPWK